MLDGRKQLTWQVLSVAVYSVQL